jgi:ribosomal protein S18 acetylase RimI-like enzyme
MASMQYVRIHHENAALLHRVADEVFDEPIMPERVAAYLENPANLLILAVTDGVVIGQIAAVLHLHPDKPIELYIDEVGVTPQYRQQGVATRLMEEIITLGKTLGCEEVWLGTELDNIPARALYDRYTTAEEIVMYAWELESSQILLNPRGES